MKICLFEPCDFESFSNGYCRRHQHLRTDDKWLNKTINKTVEPQSPIKPYKRTTSDKSELKTTKSELLKSFGFKNQKEMFDFIWQTREHKCQISGSNLDLVPENRRHWTMAHLIPKGLYPYFKLNEQNILLIDPLVHQCVDNFTEDMRLKYPNYDFDRWFDLVSEQKQKYKDFLILNQI